MVGAVMLPVSGYAALGGDAATEFRAYPAGADVGGMGVRQQAVDDGLTAQVRHAVLDGVDDRSHPSGVGQRYHDATVVHVLDPSPDLSGWTAPTKEWTP